MLAAQAVQLGDAEVVVAGGMENMSMAPYYLEKARWGYLLLLLAGFGTVVYLVMTGQFPSLALVTLLLIPLAVFACVIVFRRYAQRSLIRANVATIQLQALAGLLMAVSIFIAGVFFSA